MKKKHKPWTNIMSPIFTWIAIKNSDFHHLAQWLQQVKHKVWAYLLETWLVELCFVNDFNGNLKTQESSVFIVVLSLRTILASSSLNLMFLVSTHSFSLNFSNHSFFYQVLTFKITQYSYIDRFKKQCQLPSQMVSRPSIF